MTAPQHQCQHLVAIIFLVVATAAFPSTAAPSDSITVTASSESEHHALEGVANRSSQDDERSDMHGERSMREPPAEARDACLSANDGDECSFTADKGPAKGKRLGGKCMEGVCRVEREPGTDGGARDTEMETSGHGGKGGKKSHRGRGGKHRGTRGDTHGPRQMMADNTFDTNDAYDMESQHKSRTSGRVRASGSGEEHDHPDSGGRGGPGRGAGCGGQHGKHSNVRGAHNASHFDQMEEEGDGCGSRAGHGGGRRMPHLRTAGIAGGCAFVALAAVFVVRRRRRNRSHAQSQSQAHASTPAVIAPLPVPITPGVPVALVSGTSAKDANVTAAI